MALLGSAKKVKGCQKVQEMGDFFVSVLLSAL